MSDPSMRVHREWASRPADERWTSLTALHAFLFGLSEVSREGKVSTSDLVVKPKGTDIVLSTGKADMILNNWSARQLSALSGIPSSMYEQPAELLAQNFTWGLRARESEKLQILATKTDKALASWQVRAMTGEHYGRIANHEVVKALMDQVGDGVTGTWRVPGIRGTKLDKVTRENTTIFGGDQDVFVFLADEENRVEVKGRRDGKPGTLARGFYITNSEVGSGKARIGLYLYDFLCQNRIIWGMEAFEEISIRHTSGGPWRWLNEAKPKIDAFINASAKPAEAKIKAAQQHLLGEGQPMIDFLNRRFQKSQTINMMAVHVEEEGRPAVTRWDAVTAATAYAKTIPWQNERFQIEKKAGEMLAA